MNDVLVCAYADLLPCMTCEDQARLSRGFVPTVADVIRWKKDSRERYARMEAVFRRAYAKQKWKHGTE